MQPESCIQRESCIQCGAKHVAQARACMIEFLLDPIKYRDHWRFAWGELGEAENELVKEHLELAQMVRKERLMLMNDPSYWPPWGTMVNTIADQGDAEVEAKIKMIESQVEGKSTEELFRWWKEIRR